jgi:hypothetical protein
MVPTDLVIGRRYIRRTDDVEVRIEDIARGKVEYVTLPMLLVYDMSKVAFLQKFKPKPFRVVDAASKEEPVQENPKMAPNVFFRTEAGEERGSVLVSEFSFGAFQRGDLVDLPEHRNLEIVRRHVSVRISDSKLTLTLLVKP